MYRVAYFPYPRPSDAPRYVNPTALYPGLLAVQEPATQHIHLYRFEADYEGCSPSEYTIRAYTSNCENSELVVSISLEHDYNQGYRADAEHIYSFDAEACTRRWPRPLIGRGYFTRTGEITWGEQDPGHWAHGQVVAMIEYLAGVPTKQPELLEPGHVAVWDIPELLRSELAVTEKNSQGYTLHWFAVESTQDFGWFAYAPGTATRYPSERLPSRLVHVTQPRAVFASGEGAEAPRLVGYTADANGKVLKWGLHLKPTLWNEPEQVGLVPGLTGRKLPEAYRALVKASELRFPDERISVEGFSDGL